MAIKTAHYTYCDPGWHWENPLTEKNSYLLWIVVKGKGRMETRRGAEEIRGGNCYIMPLREEIKTMHFPPDCLEVPWAVFTYNDSKGRVIEWSPEIAKELPSFYRRLKDISFPQRLLSQAINLHISGRAEDANFWLSATLGAIAEQDKDPKLSGLELERFERIGELCHRIRANPAGDWRVEKLAREFHYSTDHFSRVFRKVKGIAPGDFIINCRMESARELLTMSSMPIGQIAELLGYNDIYHFSKQFKDKTGISPSHYRES
ncbi:MAG: helix-turn-helix transcriptional regulator [Planctomycetes bacterium]|nr:helix-turn-helix transcriptional regulator [Planctomycetota bacterium]